jgi:serine/threonine protein kinase
MAGLTGQTLSHYRVTAALGAGGMGEVYRATDTKLGRDVAIKILPPEVAGDAERLGRFEREAQLLASLNHPNIAAIYGLEEADGKPFLALELVEGEDLSDRLRRGPVPHDEALEIARQVAEGLEEAHEKGIVHRDLKPANIKLTPDGKVKVLDFGLAKAWADDPATGSSAELSQSPTLAHSGTQAGVLLGTAAYMSPEQARGKRVDKRSDIWAFGVVLWEMLTGQRLFDGETVGDILAAVLRADIDLSKLPADTPVPVRRLIGRCLERDAKRRLRDIGEARVALDPVAAESDVSTEEQAEPRRRGVSRAAFASALVAVAALATVLSWLAWRSPTSDAPLPVTEFSLWVDDLRGATLSPDGRRLAYRDGSKILVRDLADRVPREILDDSEAETFFWSPDGDELAVAINERLWRVPLDGGDRRPICDLPRPEGASRAAILDGTWLDDDTLRLAAWRGGLYEVAAAGGEPELLVPVDPKVEVDFHLVQALPDGDSLLLRAHREEPGNNQGSGAVEVYRDGHRREVALPAPLHPGGTAGYAQGFLLSTSGEASDRSLWVVPFDALKGEVTGNPSILVPRAAAARAAADGTLAYVVPRDDPRVVVKLDREGAEQGRLGQPHPGVGWPALSPDGSRVAFVSEDGELLVHDLVRDTTMRLVREDSRIVDPQWSPDGRTLYYTVDNDWLFRRIRAEPGAVAETVLERTFASFLAPDGSGIVARIGGFRQGEDDGLYWVALDESGRPGERRKLLADRSSYGFLSPDGRALAYSSTDPGRREAYLSTFPEVDQTLQLTSGGSGTPRWSPDGTSVYFITGDALVEVQVGFDGGGQLKASPARRLFELAAAGVRGDRGWNVTPDGTGFLFVKSLETDARTELVVRRHALAPVRTTR